MVAGTADKRSMHYGEESQGDKGEAEAEGVHSR